MNVHFELDLHAVPGNTDITESSGTGCDQTQYMSTME